MSLLRLVLALAALAALVHLASPAALAAALVGAAPLPLMLALVPLLACTLAGTTSFAFILRARGIRAGWRQVAATDIAGAFYALAVPAGLAAGAAVRVLRLAGGGDRVPVSAVLGAILASRLLDVLVTAAVALLVLPLLAGDLGAAAPAWGLAIAAVLGAAATAYLAGHSRRLRVWLVIHLLDRLPLRRRHRHRLRRLLRQLAGRRHGGMAAAHLLPAACIVARHLLGALGTIMLGWAFGISLSLALALWVRTLVAIALLLPLTVSGLGLREASFVVLLAPFGVAPADALALALAHLGYQLLLGAAGGLIELLAGLRGVRDARASRAAARPRPQAVPR